MRRVRNRGWAAFLALTLALGLAGCEGLLDVENPNNVLQDDVEKPQSANAMVNGALSTTARAVSSVLLAHSALTDEFDWIGSWNAAGEMEQGGLSNSANDFTNSAYNNLAVSRWMSDEAVRMLEEFDAKDSLPKRDDLARAYLYAGINYATIADSYEDVAFSDRQEVEPPVGPENMVTVYDTAVARLTRAIEIARETGNEDLEVAALAMRARAHWAKALWPKFNPADATPADPLVNSADANADAETVLNRVGGTDWRYRFEFSETTIENTAASWVNERAELIVGDSYAKADPTGKRICRPANDACSEEGIMLNDPIDDVPAPALRDIVYEFVDGYTYSPLTVVSEREMHLMLAEAALAGATVAGGTGAAAAELHINHVREMDGLTPYDRASHPETPLEMLKHERRVNLFLQQHRRLADLYRFGETVVEWGDASEALQNPGTVFPLGEQERLSNCHIVGGC